QLGVILNRLDNTLLVITDGEYHTRLVLLLAVTSLHRIVVCDWPKQTLHSSNGRFHIRFISTAFKGLFTHIIRRQTGHVGEVSDVNDRIGLLVYDVVPNGFQEISVISRTNLCIRNYYNLTG